MKECIILQYFVQDYIDEYILNRCIDSISKMNIDIILISHSTISKEIQKKVAYFLYDSEDQLITFDDIFHEKVSLHTDKRFFSDTIHVSPFLFVVDDFSYTFCKAVYNVYKLANMLGYTHSYYFTADFDVYEDELIKLKNISDLVKINKKKGYFESHSFCASVFFWYVDIKWFLDNFFINMNSKDEFLSDLKKLGLYCHYDLYISYQINKNIDNLIIKNITRCGHSFVEDDKRSDLSKKMKDQSYTNDVGIFYNDDVPCLFCFDNINNMNKWTINIEYDNKDKRDYEISLNGEYWKYFPIEIKSDKFTIKCFDKNDKLKYKVYIDDLEMYKRKFKIQNI